MEVKNSFRPLQMEYPLTNLRCANTSNNPICTPTLKLDWFTHKTSEYFKSKVRSILYKISNKTHIKHLLK